MLTMRFACAVWCYMVMHRIHVTQQGAMSALQSIDTQHQKYDADRCEQQTHRYKNVQQCHRNRLYELLWR